MSQGKQFVADVIHASLSKLQNMTSFEFLCWLDFVSDAHIHPEKAPCLGCPMEISVDSEELKVPLFVSISKYNSMSDSTHLFSLHTIEYASRQVMGGFRFKVKFDIRKTICAKAENTELNEQCVPNEQDVVNSIKNLYGNIMVFFSKRIHNVTCLFVLSLHLGVCQL